MSRRYLMLLATIVVAALGLTAWARVPRRAAAPVPAPAAPLTTLALELRDGAVTPERVAVPKDHRVRLAVANRGARTARLELAGYADVLTPREIAPGQTWSAEFLADRPGDDFTWLVDGRPAGRFTVTGSHLVEGHR